MVKLSSDQKLALQDEITNELKGHPYISTDWMIVTAVIFFGSPVVTTVVLLCAGVSPSVGVTGRVAALAVLVAGISYWLMRRDYDSKYQKEWHSRTFNPEVPL